MIIKGKSKIAEDPERGLVSSLLMGNRKGRGGCGNNKAEEYTGKTEISPPRTEQVHYLQLQQWLTVSRPK